MCLSRSAQRLNTELDVHPMTRQGYAFLDLVKGVWLVERGVGEE